MGNYYILKGHEPVETDHLTWAEAFGDTASRVVCQTKVEGLQVSTVFLGLDHSFGVGPPLLFETMVFGGDDERQQRYSTWDDAMAGHMAIVYELSRDQEGT